MGMTYSGGGDFDGDVAQICHTETMKARANHRCTECRGIVEAGQHYERTAALFDGRWSTYRKCEKCMAFESAMEQHMRGFVGGNCFGDMYGSEGDGIRPTLDRLYSKDHPGRWFSVARKLVSVRRNYDDQIKRGIVDKSGRGNARLPHKFGWYRSSQIKEEQNVQQQKESSLQQNPA